MTIHYNVTGSERKALVVAISEILALDAVYLGAPTFSYQIGNCIVDKNGILSFAEAMPRHTSSLLINALKDQGYEGMVSDNDTKLVIEIPREGFSDVAMENLRKIVASKESLIKKALGSDSLRIEVVEEKLCCISHTEAICTWARWPAAAPPPRSSGPGS